ncbi:hypothetical protein A2643_00560 [Candidatus Nomurabacteria bacterium RIFCSPHIGHO2_01_FULL_39_220]|uniref:Type IV pilus modification protein PilV n=1 Tax=Candidatus Nomurabacteria bacterium RIFCSPLOWO2_02_FULL_40_67 TaxID=1801787 RepID=A0A1F6Y427_9BACT|nr:MAG: hypothetical protein UU01_C0002G0029 [Parcubacteria group bacterium GW2011_GWA2_40_37]OGI62049.1 MAG: hypothetical protein A2W12_01695 [Candidatus Nomurabacteria bacterium RBG_16_40_11]OGI70264.1 MAG: hypothetical protein A2643_00560 [Candidatus Nomurabacteria bacterium RIFCSPHIGHO2_01_FULL_39_220]OGI73467.1 MAG: hypothetical protein A2W56_02160 [Candidatus Nomurabacteria bacterium RIFCSPHIGHO2_02_41_18]OGI78736.1 MAG: hypothetical protein A3C65_02090 [Candidatus Nomurabacteria bacteriu
MPKEKLQKKFTTGFMVIEVLIASSIITVSILAAMAVAQKSVYVSRQAFHVSQAAFLLEEGAENARIARDNAWSNVTALNSSETVGIFTRTAVASSVNRDNATKDIVTSGGTSDAGTKLITVTVSWKEGGTTVTKTLQFYLTDVFS